MPIKTAEELQHIITKKINGFCEKNGDGRIFQPVNYILQLGGKRIRPLLSLMSANMFSDDIEEAVYPAIAYEVFHNFTLMHDDIMDDAPLRRGQPTVHEKWNVNTAILSGDAMMIQAYQLLIKTDSSKLTSLLQLFNTTALEVCIGQQMDMDFEKEPQVSVSQYEEMIKLKTSVLLAASMKSGAIISNADQESCEHIYAFGIHLGLAFQLLDDYLDSFGDENFTGKRKGGDILADKKTMLMIRAFEKANSAELAVLNQYIGNKKADEEQKIKAILELYTTLGVAEELKTKVLHHHDTALEHLRLIKVEDSRKSALLQITSFLLERKG
jgi:geranylgeranyl diphosphate synthase type II